MVLVENDVPVDAFDLILSIKIANRMILRLRNRIVKQWGGEEKGHEVGHEVALEELICKDASEGKKKWSLGKYG